MNKYENIILNTLLDKYENSLSYIGLNKVNQTIQFKFSKTTLPDYFKDDGDYFYIINDTCEALQDRNLIRISWKNKIGHLINSVELVKENADSVYNYLKRVKKQEKSNNLLDLLFKYQDKHETLMRFAQYINSRLNENKGIKQYINDENLEEVEWLLIGVEAVISNKEEIFLRELSVKLYNDSKRLEALEKKIKKIIIDFSEEKEEYMSVEDLFSEFNILKNPSFITIKGVGAFSIRGNTVNLEAFTNGIGISSLDLNELQFIPCDKVSKIITIENLTSFNRFNAEEAIIIYLGGYHNEARRNLLKSLYKIYNNLSEFYHFGDIDVGGLRILNHLRTKTGIDIKPLMMNKETLITNQKYCKSLTNNDIKALKDMLESSMYMEFYDLIQYMLSEGIKLEQEIISF